ncbi:MAG: flagellar basal body P-ring formation chaperone FlgA [Symbiopectobacterium sp.]|uniref:flagellar basal body P-ring formation chaperone FlgA n=1 Tax=Symbiopectobacterium sp. TaxID=2952789 RepID=UPI0039E7E2B6
MKTKFYPILFALLTSLIGNVHAADLQAQLEQFFHARFPDKHNSVTVVIKTPQEQWPQCKVPLLTLPHTRVWGNVSISVRCGEQRRFIQAEVQVTGNYLVSARQLRRGVTLAAADVRQSTGRLDLLPPPALLLAKEALGAVLLRDLPPGQPLTSAMLRHAWVVKSGQTVQVLAQGVGFSINSEGKATSNAAAGQSVRVRIASGQIVNGVAGEDGVIYIAQ